MSDLLQNVLIIFAISSMPLGALLLAIIWMLAQANRKLILANNARIDDLRTRVLILETRDQQGHE